MSFLTRLLEKLDDNLHVDIPQPRDAATEETAVPRLTPPGYRFEIAGYWSHCKCCSAYTPQPCPVVHPGPCDKPECGDPRDVTG